METGDPDPAALEHRRRSKGGKAATRATSADGYLRHDITMLQFNLDDVARFAGRLKRLHLEYADIFPLLENWERQMEAGNRKGILAGTDGKGDPMPLVTYRPRGLKRKLTLAERLGQRPNLRRGKYGGRGPAQGEVIANNNLTSAAYRTLDGPPLAPRRQYSRVITNAVTAHYGDPTNRTVWYVELGWGDVVSAGGFPFLAVHFDGKPLGKKGPRKRRDLRGIRPETKALMLKSFRSWAALAIRGKAFMEGIGL